MKSRTQFLLLSIGAMPCGVSAITPLSSLAANTLKETAPSLWVVRGGASASSSSSSKKKKTKKKKRSTGKAKKAIDTAMKEKDTAEALGDAIRDRADVLREEDPLLQSIDWSISSLGSAMGASDKRRTDGGGVEAATTSVLANYFLKSHGGAHGLQSLCSLLATMASVGAVVFRKSPLGFTFLKQAMMFAMIKHVSGLLAGASLAAKAVPKIGLAEARQWVEQLVLDPVSQYVFYTSVILLWLPPKQRLDYCWWWKQFWAAPALVGPILVREVIGILMVVSDVLVLCSVGEEGAIQTVLKVSQSIINAVMSLLVSPQTWRGADPAERQAILAKLVSRVSLCFEVIVGALLSMDFVRGLFETAFTSGPNRPPLKYALIRLLCVRLYVHFLYVRRKKIAKLASKLRGGAAQLPFWFLDIVYAPVKSMGLERESMDNEELTWRDYMSVGLGLSN